MYEVMSILWGICRRIADYGQEEESVKQQLKAETGWSMRQKNKGTGDSLIENKKSWNISKREEWLEGQMLQKSQFL